MTANSAHLLERARAWLDELRELDDAASQVSRVGLLGALAVSSAVTLVLALASTFGWTRAVNPSALYIASAACGIALAVVWRMPRAASTVSVSLLALISLAGR